MSARAAAPFRIDQITGSESITATKSCRRAGELPIIGSCRQPTVRTDTFHTDSDSMAVGAFDAEITPVGTMKQRICRTECHSSLVWASGSRLAPLDFSGRLQAAGISLEA